MEQFQQFGRGSQAVVVSKGEGEEEVLVGFTSQAAALAALRAHTVTEQAGQSRCPGLHVAPASRKQRQLL